MPKKRILVVDDEEDIVELVRYNLSKEGFDVVCASNGTECLERVERHSPDLIVLDLMMPGMGGLEVCRHLKANYETASIPIIMLTAKTEESDVVLGLELGADDYVLKPFSAKILTARARRVLRRLDSSSAEGCEILRRGGIELNILGRCVQIGGEDVFLTFSEFEILRLLMTHPGRVYSRSQIMRGIRDDEYIVTERTIDVQIVNLRKKLGRSGKCVRTVRGFGYKFQT
ncbi:MAG: response regulator [Kiritimatiellaeota bacterium]|nr:response regulator [Kiritimatiellota bacterium]